MVPRRRRWADVVPEEQCGYGVDVSPGSREALFYLVLKRCPLTAVLRIAQCAPDARYAASCLWRVWRDACAANGFARADRDACWMDVYARNVRQIRFRSHDGASGWVATPVVHADGTGLPLGVTAAAMHTHHRRTTASAVLHLSRRLTLFAGAWPIVCVTAGAGAEADVDADVACQAPPPSLGGVAATMSTFDWERIRDGALALFAAMQPTALTTTTTTTTMPTATAGAAKAWSLQKKGQCQLQVALPSASKRMPHVHARSVKRKRAACISAV